MTSKQTNKITKQNEQAIEKRQNIPVQLTDLSIFDNTYAFMKERFTQEMKRIDQQMNKFSTALTQCYEQGSSVQTGPLTNPPGNWDALENSPLVQGEGEDKTLKLQFDVSQFDAAEINVRVLNDLLVIRASHEEKTNDTTVLREYNREFKLPPGTNPELVISSLSRDGVLTVQAPLARPVEKSILQPRSHTAMK